MNNHSPKMTFHGTMQEFEKIVNDNKLLLYSVVYTIAGNYEADDIVQETFVYAYYHYASLKDKTKLSPWLCAIARNKAYDSIKQSCRTLSMDTLGERASYVTPESLLLRREEKDLLRQQISELSEKYRETVVLYYFAGKTVREIAELLGIPEGTVKFRLSESRKKLKKELLYMLNEEKKSVEEKDIFQKIKEVTEQANKALMEKNTKAASKICDSILAEADAKDLSALSNDELRALSYLYITKGSAVRYAEGHEVFAKYLKKRVEIAEASGDDDWISEMYSYYASELSNMGRNEESQKYNKLALEKAEKCGGISALADRLFWNGISAVEENDFALADTYFKRVLSMKEPLLSDKEYEARSKDAYVLAYSAHKAIERAGEHIACLTGFDSTAPAIARKAEGYSLAGQPGYGGGDPLHDIFYYISRMTPFLSEKLREGYTFQQNTFSFSHMPIRSRYEVVSMDEAYDAPAGRFEDCLHVRFTNYLSEGDTKITNKLTNGVSDIWYAPHVGVVGFEFSPLEGDRKCVRLLEYSVEVTADAGLPERYLPLSVGNTWSYETYDLNDTPCSEDFEYENLFEVVCVREADNAAVIAHSGWCAERDRG